MLLLWNYLFSIISVNVEGTSVGTDSLALQVWVNLSAGLQSSHLVHSLSWI